jgi:hypothetical protein
MSADKKPTTEALRHGENISFVTWRKGGNRGKKIAVIGKKIAVIGKKIAVIARDRAESHVIGKAKPYR